MPVKTATIAMSSSFVNLSVNDDFRLGNYEIVDAMDGMTNATANRFLGHDSTHGLVYDVTGTGFTYHEFAPGVIDDVTGGTMTKAILKTSGGTTIATITFDTGVDMAGMAGSPDEATLNGIFGQYAYTYNGFSGADSFTGMEQGDTINGGAGDDTLIGGAGDDVIKGGAGADTLDGGTHTLGDTVSYAGSTAGVTVNLLTSTASGGDAAGDTIANFENILGSSQADTLTGDGNANVIEGGLGNDTMVGGGGTDTLSYAGATAGITVSLATLTAQNTGGAGTDTVSGFENITGSAFADNLTGDAGNNTIIGGKGGDYITGGDGDDVLQGGENGAANTDWDRVFYTTASSAVTVDLSNTGAQDTKGAGIDTLSGFEYLFGSSYDDKLTGDANNNALNGWGGDDWLIGGAGADSLEGGVPEQNGDNDDFNDTADYSGITNAAAALTIALGAGGTPVGVMSAVASDATGDAIARVENLIGGSGDDKFTGNEYANKLYGGEGNDTLEGRGGADLLDGGNGTDTASYALSTAAVQVDLGGTSAGGEAAGDTYNSIEVVVGSKYNDQMKAGATAATLKGGAGNDMLQGGIGDDTLEGGAGGDQINGGLGEDLVSYLGSGAAVTVNLVKNTGSGGDAAGDFYNSIEDVEGSKLNDTLIASNWNSKLYGGVGNDTLKSGDRDDTLDGGDGTGIDTASYALSKLGVTVDLSIVGVQDTVGAGKDTLVDIENLIGSSGDDTLTGNDENNRIEGGARNDLIEGGLGNDTLIAGSGIDTLSYAHAGGGVSVSLALTSAQNTGAAGTDTVSGFENLTGGTGGDTLTGNADENTIDAGDGIDLVQGGAGADVLKGGNGSDTVSYAASTVGVSVDLSIQDGAKMQVSDGDAEGDILQGFENLIGSNEDDALYGDDNDNVIEGRGGDDILVGGLGNDTLSYGSSTTAVTVSLSGGDFQNTGGAGIDTISGFENLSGGSGADTLTGDAGVNSIFGLGGNDTLSGNGGSDFLYGGDGTDTAAFAWVGSDGLSANLSTSKATLGGDTTKLDSIENLKGSDHDDELIGDAGNNRIDGGQGDDRISGELGDDVLIGGSGGEVGGDTVFYESAGSGVTVSLALTTAQTTGGAGKDTLSGFENLSGSVWNDTLTGDKYANKIEGNNGDDVLNGGLGNDSLVGGIGDDAFVFNTALNAVSNLDTIDDFEVGVDEIRLENAIFTTLTAVGDLNAAAFYIGSAAHDGDDRIIYDNVSGALYYDKDGSGTAAAVQFATLDPGLGLAAADFKVT